MENKDKLAVNCITTLGATGFHQKAKIMSLLQDASKYGGKALQDYSSYCARMASVLHTMMIHVNLEKVTLVENSSTGAVRYRGLASLEDITWTYTITTKQIHSFESSEGRAMYLTTEVLCNEDEDVYSASYVSTLKNVPLDFKGNFCVAVCKSRLSQVVNIVKASSKVKKTLDLYKLSSRSFNTTLEVEVAQILKQNGLASRVTAALGVSANLVMATCLIISVVLSTLKKNTIWQLTVLNKSSRDFYWTSVLNYGDINSCPIDTETNQYYRKFPKPEAIFCEDNCTELSYMRTEFDLINEQGLYGIKGEFVLRMQESATEEQPKFNFAFNIPYNGKNSVTLTSPNRFQSEETGLLAYQLIDEVNNLKFTYSLSNEKGKHRVATINNGEEGYNYNSSITIEDLKANFDI